MQLFKFVVRRKTMRCYVCCAGSTWTGPVSFSRTPLTASIWTRSASCAQSTRRSERSSCSAACFRPPLCLSLTATRRFSARAPCPTLPATCPRRSRSGRARCAANRSRLLVRIRTPRLALQQQHLAAACNCRDLPSVLLLPRAARFQLRLMHLCVPAIQWTPNSLLRLQLINLTHLVHLN